MAISGVGKMIDTNPDYEFCFDGFSLAEMLYLFTFLRTQSPAQYPGIINMIDHYLIGDIEQVIQMQDVGNLAKQFGEQLAEYLQQENEGLFKDWNF